MRTALKALIKVLFRLGILKRPIKRLYVVQIKIYLDGRLVKQFPTTYQAFSRRVAKHELRKVLGFDCATTASNLGKNKDGEYVFLVTLNVQVNKVTVKKFSMHVNAPGRRAAKFDIGKRLVFTTGAAARAADLKKHLKQRA